MIFIRWLSEAAAAVLTVYSQLCLRDSGSVISPGRACVCVCVCVCVRSASSAWRWCVNWLYLVCVCVCVCVWVNILLPLLVNTPLCWQDARHVTHKIGKYRSSQRCTPETWGRRMNERDCGKKKATLDTHTHTRSLIPTHRCCDRLTFAGSKYQRPPRPLVTSPEFTVYIWKAKRRREGKYRRGGKRSKEKRCLSL